MNAGAYGTQIGTHVREVELYRASTGKMRRCAADEFASIIATHHLRRTT